MEEKISWNEKMRDLISKIKNHPQKNMMIGIAKSGSKKETLLKGGAEYIINELDLTVIYEFDYDFSDKTKQNILLYHFIVKLYIPGDTTPRSVGHGITYWKGHVNVRMSENATLSPNLIDFAQNKAIKMAKKRALVDAVLSLGFSAYVTQDMDEIIEEFIPATKKEASSSKPATRPLTAKPILKSEYSFDSE